MSAKLVALLSWRKHRSIVPDEEIYEDPLNLHNNGDVEREERQS